jgi:hypothetical protein
LLLRQQQRQQNKPLKPCAPVFRVRPSRSNRKTGRVCFPDVRDKESVMIKAERAASAHGLLWLPEFCGGRRVRI